MKSKQYFQWSSKSIFRGTSETSQMFHFGLFPFDSQVCMGVTIHRGRHFEDHICVCEVKVSWLWSFLETYFRVTCTHPSTSNALFTLEVSLHRVLSKKKREYKNCSFLPWQDKINLKSLLFIWKYLFSSQLYADRHFLKLVIEVEISTEKKS